MTSRFPPNLGKITTSLYTIIGGVTVIWAPPSFEHPRPQIPSVMGTPTRDTWNTDSTRAARGLAIEIMDIYLNNSMGLAQWIAEEDETKKDKSSHFLFEWEQARGSCLWLVVYMTILWYEHWNINTKEIYEVDVSTTIWAPLILSF